MKRREGSDLDGELPRLIRRSRVLDPSLKRHWLRVLPHLAPVDRERLRALLETGEALAGQEQPASASPGLRRAPERDRTD